MTTAVVVGSGPNGLSAALTLAAAGISVRVLEAADTLGGGVRSSELTLPGLIHDDCSGFHPLALDNAFSRAFDLTQAGLTWRWPEVQFSHPLDEGRGAAAYQSVADTAAGLGEDGRAWSRMFGSLSDRFDTIAEEFLQPVLHLPDHPLHLARFGAYAALPASVLARRFSTDEGRALFGGGAAHAMRPFGGPASSAIGVALITAAHRYGWPVAEGGSQAIATAMVRLGEGLGVTYETGVEVTSYDDLGAPDLVLLDTAPGAAADILGDRMPRRAARGYRRFRHGPGAFKVDYAVADGVPWTHQPSRRAGTVHVGGSVDEMAHTERAVARGRMPDRPFLLVGQQYVADPSRSVEDVHPLYAYAHVPAGFDGDTHAATEAITAQIERFAPGFRDRILATHVRSAVAMEEHNANYVGGDIVTGANDPFQLVFRPRPTLRPYNTGVPGAYLCSAATPPGAGAHGMCGYLAAQTALRDLAH
ncbi:NAD(P)/FAD-dependent oxidoreductase [Nocardioides salsibiostraticola]